MTPAEVLRAARAKIEKPENWCQGEAYMDKDGFASSRTACRWCALGAAWSIAEVNGVRRQLVDTFLERAAGNMGYSAIRGQGMATAILNDTTDHATVLAMFDAAISLAEQEEGKQP